VVVTAVMVTAVPVTTGVPISGVPTWRDIAVNPSMLAQPLNTPMVDTVHWTLGVELRFYPMMLSFAEVVAVAGGDRSERKALLRTLVVT
jgi:hypothetical protein